MAQDDTHSAGTQAPEAASRGRMNGFAVAAMGADRPGIVAAAGEALLQIGANIDDSAMTILGGHFAMLLTVHAPAAREQLEGALQPVVERFGLLLEVRDVEPTRWNSTAHDDYVVAAYGPDRPGLVTALSRVLADAGVNITDLGSRVGEDHTFAMWFNVGLPAGADVDTLGERLRAVGRDLQLDVRLYRAEAEEL